MNISLSCKIASGWSVGYFSMDKGSRKWKFRSGFVSSIRVCFLGRPFLQRGLLILGNAHLMWTQKDKNNFHRLYRSPISGLVRCVWREVQINISGGQYGIARALAIQQVQWVSLTSGIYWSLTQSPTTRQRIFHAVWCGIFTGSIWVIGLSLEYLPPKNDSKMSDIEIGAGTIVEWAKQYFFIISTIYTR